MAADMESTATLPQDDPLLGSSLGGHLAFWALLLVLSTLWAGYDEFVAKRPWKAYQSAFLAAYDEVLVREQVGQQAREDAVRGSEDYAKLDATIRAEAAKQAPELARIDARTSVINRRLHRLNRVIKFPKGRLGALRYRIDEAADPEAKQRLEADYHEVAEVAKYSVELPAGGGRTETVAETYVDLVRRTEDLKAERARLVLERGRVDRTRAAAAKAQQALVQRKMPGLTPDAIVGLRKELDEFVVGVKQIHVADVGLVDRCETCHLGIESPIRITDAKLAAAGVTDGKLRKMFASHPRPEALDAQPDLLEIHPPDKFGCSPCHNGNGTGTISARLAHGRNKHWLWKLFEPDNYEAGCQQCHEGSIWVDGAPVLDAGRELFRKRGCWACHKREGFDREAEALQEVATAIKTNRTTLEQRLEERRDVLAILDDDDTPDDMAEAAVARDRALTIELSEVRTEYDSLRAQQRNLNLERKRQGPNLKEIKAKLRREWVLPWLLDPRGFRPRTKMPQFRLSAAQARAIAAFIWNRALDIPVPKQPAGDAARGRELFEKRGCMGCHSLAADHPEAGGDFAADLSRVGEKVRYDYLVRWVHDPRVRLAPYSPSKKAKDGDGDVRIADYRRAGKEPVWDRDHTVCPVSGGEMVVENQTVMPSLRLTWEEARDIASFLMTRKTDKEYGDAGFPAGPGTELLAYGEKLVKHFGCAGCHEIRGLEEEDRIGTELTKEGSKPIERLDFGLLTHDLKRGTMDLDGDGRPDKYDHRSFFMNKLKRPEVWDRGKDKTEFEALKMPNFGLADDERTALTTFLLGSVDSRFPDRFYYHATGPEKDIEDGWWVVKKYNCQGCHQLRPNDTPRIQTLDWFGGENAGDAPPSLVGQGFRTNPKWLARFLANPSLTDDPAEMHRNGVRRYLTVRMPTFKLTEDEIQKLVRFFAALSEQPLPQVETAIDPLPPDGIAAAKAAFDKQVCLKCHITTGPLTPQVIAPSFVISGERLNPAWVERWLIDPQKLAPGTKMPSGLFKQEAGRWIFASPKAQWPPALQAWGGDHVRLLVRYMRQYNKINK